MGLEFFVASNGVDRERSFGRVECEFGFVGVRNSGAEGECWNQHFECRG